MTFNHSVKKKTRKQINKNPEHFHKSNNVISAKLINTYLQNSTEGYFYESIQQKREVFVLFKGGRVGRAG